MMILRSSLESQNFTNLRTSIYINSEVVQATATMFLINITIFNMFFFLRVCRIIKSTVIGGGLTSNLLVDS